MAQLRTDYKDEILDVSVNAKRKYRQVDNGDGTISFVDVTEYSQQGDPFGAGDINATNQAVNDCFQSVSDGKALVASAITDKGVSTDATATFATMAENIANISTDLSKNAKTICAYDYEIDGLTWTASGLTTGKTGGYRSITKASTNGSVMSNVIDNSEGYAYVKLCIVGMVNNDKYVSIYDESGTQIGSKVSATTPDAPVKLATNGKTKIKIKIETSTSATSVTMYLASVVLCNS